MYDDITTPSRQETPAAVSVTESRGQTPAHLALPGRLGNPEMAPRTDPRTHPRLLAALESFDLASAAVSPPITPDASADRLAEFLGQAEAAREAFYGALPNDLPGDAEKVVHSTEALRLPGGNVLSLHVFRPAQFDGPLPCVVYMHGGGLTILKTDNKVHRQWCEDLAATGMVAIAVDFRNAYSPEGPNPFPAALDDCSHAAAWIHAHREQLGITRVVLQGESGGGNLVLATALRANSEGQRTCIDGVYAMVPMISGAYGWDEDRRLQELPSLVECDGYFLHSKMLHLLGAAYDAHGAHATNPLCWPYLASEAQLAGLPPHVISVNELDPLRDEGLVYYRRLTRAGVSVRGRVNPGLTHAADSIFRQAAAAFYVATIRDIKGFADAV